MHRCPGYPHGYRRSTGNGAQVIGPSKSSVKSLTALGEGDANRADPLMRRFLVGGFELPEYLLMIPYSVKIAQEIPHRHKSV
jgi:hypothetical protein